MRITTMTGMSRSPQSSIVALVSCGQTTTVEFDLKLTELDGTHAWYYKANEEPMDKRS